MAKTPKTTLKRSTKGATKKDESIVAPVAKKPTQAESEGKFFRVKANIEFYDLKYKVLHKKSDEWDESDESRVKRLKSCGFITVL